MTRERWRVVQLAIGPAGAPEEFGSGYVVGRNAVLTADHVVKGRDPRECSVRFPSAETPMAPVAVTEIISGAVAGCDIAVLLTEDVGGLVYPNPVRFGRLVFDQVEELPAVSWGYPRWKRREVDRDGRELRFRTITDVRGTLKLVTLDGAGGLEFVMRDALPGVDKAGPWNAMSGSPVWVDDPLTERGDRLVGVVIEHHPAEGTGRLVVQPVQDLYALADAARDDAVRPLGLPSTLDNLQVAPGLRPVVSSEPGPDGIARFALESDFLPRKALFTGIKYLIGRDENNQVVVDREGIDRIHCQIWVERKGAAYTAYVQDELSNAGTTVNDVAVKANDPFQLAPDDKIALGTVASFHLRTVRLR